MLTKYFKNYSFKLSAKEPTIIQCNDDAIYDDVCPIDSESDLNQQEEYLKDTARRNAMVRIVIIVVIYIYLSLTNIIYLLFLVI